MPCSLPVHVLCNREGCFASENMNNARSESWPLVQRSYIKFTCEQTRWRSICFVMNLFFVFFCFVLFFSYRAAQRSTGGRYFCPNGYNRKKMTDFLSIWLSCSHSSAWYCMSSPSSVSHIIHKNMTNKVLLVLLCMKYLYDSQTWNRDVY